MSIPRLLTIRAAQYEENLRALLQRDAVSICAVPLLYYSDLFIQFKRLKRYHYLIVTSKHAASIIADKYLYQAQCLVVGRESAALLDKNPHLNILGVFNNSAELADYLVQANLPCVDTLYLCGNKVTIDFSQYADCIELYRTIYRNDLEVAEVNQLLLSVDYVFLYSENAAKQFIYICNKYDLLQSFKKSVVITISKKVAQVICNHFGTVIPASEPSSVEMINILRAKICK